MLENSTSKGVQSIDPLKDNISSIELIDYMGSELSIVNDARVSYSGYSESLSDKDIKLIKYLIDNDHTSPLRGVCFKFRVKAPLFIARQWWKHVIASSHIDDQNSWNEMSMRYTQVKEPEFYIPLEFRGQSAKNKQASDVTLSKENSDECYILYKNSCEMSYNNYNTLIEQGVSREMARGVLPTSTYTTWIWTCSLQSLLNFLNLRDSNHAQTEITLYAKAIKQLVSKHIPNVINLYKWENLE